MFDRYNIVDEADLKGAANQLKEHFDRDEVITRRGGEAYMPAWTIPTKGTNT